MAHLAGVVVIWTVMFGLAYLFFEVQNVITKGGIRLSEEEGEITRRGGPPCR